MTVEGWVALAGVAVGVVALFVSIRANRTSNRTAREQTLLQTQLLKIESARERERRRETEQASLRASALHGEGRPQLVIHNQGESAVTWAAVLIDGVAPGVHGFVYAGPQAYPLAPGAKVQYGILVMDGGPREFRVELRWEDLSGVPGKWTGIVAV